MALHNSPAPEPPPLLDAASAESTLLHLRWARGRPLCPHCACRQAYRLTSLDSGGARFKCARCRRQYSARRGTVMERSNIPTSRWLVAIDLYLASPGRGLATRIARATGVSFKGAASMVRRLKDAGDDPLLMARRRQLLGEGRGLSEELDSASSAPAAPRPEITRNLVAGI